MPFSESDYENILKQKGNELLCIEPKCKYEQYKTKDPFPEIGDALLNSIDIVRYCMTTGMIEPFSIENVEGVTYTCHFSGKYYFWEGKSNELNRKTEADTSDDLLLRPNSITYLEIDEVFRIPDYLIMRYNLQVSHVYKGLLLGTGPIVDPGFEGHLYIPLHNLTSNEYLVKKGAPLITLEFTKVGRNYENSFTKAWPEIEQANLDFLSIEHQPRKIVANRDFDTYIKSALKGSDLFSSTNEKYCVGSSIPEKIQSAEASAKNAEESAKKSEESLKSTKKLLFSLGFAGFIALLISIAALWISTVGFINDVSGRIDNVISDIISISADNNRLQDENSRLSEEKASLQAIIDKLTSNEKFIPSEEAEE